MIIDAILWDYDGTMINSVPKNISITRAILTEVAPRFSGSGMPDILGSISKYQTANHAAENWRDLYMNYYGLTAEETDLAGTLWGFHQMANKTPVSAFDGIVDTVRSLSQVRQGICSQNSTENILRVLVDNDIDQHIQQIVGYDDIPYHSQKPAPDSGLLCLDRMFGSTHAITLLYVGDHEADTIFARNIQKRLGTHSTVLSVAVTYSGAKPDSWAEKPDWIIDAPAELIERLNHSS